MRILTAHQPSYMPWLGFFHKIALSDIYVSLDDVQFEKNSFINRNKIKSNGNSLWITVPILTKGHMEKTIKDMEINNSLKWAEKHYKSLFFNYQHAPYFESYENFFRKLYKKKWEKIVNLNEYILKFLFKELNFDVDFVKMSNLQVKFNKENLILELCELFNVDEFIFGALGENYVNVNNFKKKGIEPFFQSYNHPTYQQSGKNFIPNLSRSDLILNVGGKEAKKIIIKDNIKKSDILKWETLIQLLNTLNYIIRHSYRFIFKQKNSLFIIYN